MTRQVRKPEPIKTLLSTPLALKANGEALKQTKAEIEDSTKEILAFNAASFDAKQTKITAAAENSVNAKKAEIAVINDQIADLLKQLQAATIAKSKKETEIAEVRKASQKEIQAARKVSAEFNAEAQRIRKSDLKDANKQALAHNVEAIGHVFGEMIASGVYVKDGTLEGFTKFANGIKNVVAKVGENYQEGFEAPTNRKVPKTIQPKK